MKQRTLRAQALEPRALLAVDVSLDALSGELRILGTPSDDVVEVADDLLSIHVTDTSGAKPERQSFSKLLVRSISFRGGLGDDEFVTRVDLPASLYGQEGNDTLIGGPAADLVVGGDGNDVLRGGAGMDRLIGGIGADQLFGDDDADRLEGEDGDDVLRGGRGDDYLHGGTGGDQLYGDEGDDSLTGAEDRDYLYGGLGNDILRGGDTRDILRGNEGDDQLFGDSGSDLLRGDEGNDTLNGDVGSDQLYGGAGDDSLDGGTGDDTLNGDEDDDLLMGREGDDILSGGAGNDDLRGDDGLNQLFGDDGNDLLSGGPLAELLRGGAGNDVLRGSGGDDEIWGDAGFDVLRGDDGDDVLNGGLDRDELYGENGVDRLDGGAGNDTLDGGTGDDTLNGDEDDDLLLGREGDDVLTGGTGHDDLRGDDGINQLFGGDGNDLLTGGPLEDLLRGGLGNDVLRGMGGDDEIWGDAGFDVLRGDDGDDRLYGGLDRDEIYGGLGQDLLDGDNGDDWLVGDDGNDQIIGRAGRDEIWGGDGADRIYGGDDADMINGGEGADLIRGETGNDVILGGGGGDNINGDDGNDDIQGNDGDDELMGGRGNDVVRGGWGLDHVRGLDGDDSLFGDQDADILVGGQGDDVLVGGTSPDLLIGGIGADVLGGNDGGDLLVGGTTIYDDAAASLRLILSNWNGAVVFQEAAEHFLSNQASPSLRPFETVFDDGAADWLEGDDDRDWFFWFSADTMADRRQDESVTGGDLSSSAWIKRLHLDLLGRQPTSAEVKLNEESWEAGFDPNAIVLGIVRGQEYRTEQLRFMYRQTLGRDISADEINSELIKWALAGGPERIWADLLGSAEFFAAHGSNDAEAVQAMFNVVLRRTAPDAELAVSLESLPGGARAEVAYDLLTSDEARTTWINNAHREFLHRAPDEAELDYWLRQYRKGVSTEQIQSRLLSSTAHLNQPYFEATAFGATPNDALDDTAAIQAAIDLAGMAGSSVVYLGQGLFVAENLRISDSHIKFVGPGTLKLRGNSSAVGVLTVEGDFNVVAYISIDGNKQSEHTGRAEGLRVIGNDNRVYRVTAKDTLYDANSSPAGINFMIGGARNTLIETKSYNAGHSSYRQIGNDNLYRDINGINARVKGFNGMGDGSSFTVDGGYFETNAPDHELGVNSFQVDPGPSGKRIHRVVLRNVVAKGPENSVLKTTNVAKFALVDEIVIENSSFTHRAENIYSLRFAEGVGKVLLRDVFLSRAMYMEQDTHDGSGLQDPLDELVMQRVTIGDGVHRPTFAMEEVEVGRLLIDDCRFIGYTIAGIDWEAPEGEYTQIAVTGTLFRGWNETRTTYDILPNDGGELANPARRYWSNVKRRNGGGAGAVMMP